MTTLSWARTAIAFLRRDALIRHSYRGTFLLEVIATLMSVGMFYFIGRVVDSGAPPLLRSVAPHGYFLYALAGLALGSTLTASVSGFSEEVRQSQLTGTLEAVLVTPIAAGVAVVWGSLWTFARSGIRVAVCLAVGAAVGAPLVSSNWLAVATMLVLAASALAPFGVLAAAFVVAFKRPEPVNYATNAAVMFLAGAYFPVELLPGWLSRIAWFFPLTHAVSGFRCALFLGCSLSALASEVAALVGATVVLWPLSLWVFGRAIQAAKRHGTLAQY